MNAWQREIRAWTADSRKAQRSDDKKLLAKVQKQQSRIMQLQGKVFKQSLKPMLVYFVPFMLLWQLFLIPLFGVGTMAYFPGLGGGYIELPLFLWYLICSFASGRDLHFASVGHTNGDVGSTELNAQTLSTDKKQKTSASPVAWRWYGYSFQT